MIYVDTNVIISNVDSLDPNHKKASALLGSLRGHKVVSKLTLIELSSVYFRAGLEDPLALAMYSLKRSNVELADIDFNLVVANAFRIASMFKLRTLNLLHVSVCVTVGAKIFVTFDKEIIANTDLLRKMDVEVITS